MKKIIVLLLILAGFNIARAQQPFSKVDQWLAEHVSDMSGRLMLVLSVDKKNSIVALLFVNTP